MRPPRTPPTRRATPAPTARATQRATRPTRDEREGAVRADPVRRRRRTALPASATGGDADSLEGAARCARDANAACLCQAAVDAGGIAGIPKCVLASGG